MRRLPSIIDRAQKGLLAKNHRVPEIFPLGTAAKPPAIDHRLAGKSSRAPGKTKSKMPVFQVEPTATKRKITPPMTALNAKPIADQGVLWLVSPLRQFPLNKWNWRRGAGEDVVLIFSKPKTWQKPQQNREKQSKTNQNKVRKNSIFYPQIGGSALSLMERIGVDWEGLEGSLENDGHVPLR